MSKPNILIVWSNYYDDLAKKQLDSCVQILEQSNYSYQIETVEAGTYEIPAVIQYYHHNKPFEGYIPLSLLLKGNTDHYEFILDHVKTCFTRFAMDGILIGNGIISAPSLDLLTSRVEQGERVDEACRAIDYLIRLTHKK